MIIAAIQMVSTPNVEQNLATALELMQQAKQQGAELIVLPEYWPMMGLRDTDKFAVAELDGSGPLQDFLAEQARLLSVTIIAGSIPLRSPVEGKIFNTCNVYGPTGERLARYDKIHLFGFSQGDEAYQESKTILDGKQPVSFESNIGRVGLGICYDLRFPELFRQMRPCNLIVIPAAFTYTTGRVHWEILLRARAIENQCYVLASAQGGLHENGRRTWGHSMLIDPWGEVMAVLDQGSGVIIGEFDEQKIQQVRQNLPALDHIKLL
jgi:nitrilase